MVKGPISKVIEPSALVLCARPSTEMTSAPLVAVCPISNAILEECVSV